MTRWLAGRVLQAIATLLVALTLIFFLMRITPGDPLLGVPDENPLTPAQDSALRAKYNVDQPLLTQFRAFVGGLVHGDLGPSFHYKGRPVTGLLAERLPASLLLGATVLLLNFGLGMGLGVLQALRRGRPIDRWLTFLSLAGYAMPSFWLGLVLTWGFGIHWHLFPVAFMRDPLLSPDAGWWVITRDVLRHLVLPAATLSAVSIAATMRYQRTAMLEVLRLDFVRTARMKGLRERRVVWRHAWRNALTPLLALLGLWLPLLVSGSVFVEYVFAWPGLGSLAAEAIGARDYPVIMGTAILVSSMVVAGGLLTDLAQLVLDPRVREA